MIKKILMAALVLVVISVSMAGCLQPQPQAVPTPSATPVVTASPTKAATPTPKAPTAPQAPVKEITKVIVVPAAPTATPSAPKPPVVTMQITGPTRLTQNDYGSYRVHVTVNGNELSSTQLAGQIYWFIDGRVAAYGGVPGTLSIRGGDAMWEGNGGHTLTAEYLGGPVSTSITVWVYGSTYVGG